MPAGAEWRHEVKYDGYRLQAQIAHGTVRLLTRTGLDWTEKFPTIAALLANLPTRRAIVDGEVVALDEEGRSRFQLLQGAISGTGGAPLVYFVFDILDRDGRDLRPLPFDARRTELRRLLGRRSGAVRLSETMTGAAEKLLAEACRRGLEGVVSKRGDAPYQSGRTRTWIKTKCGGRQDFVVVGFTPPRGSRNDLGSLLLAVRDAGDTLRYAGRVGTGMGVADLKTLRARLDPLRRKTPPVSDPPHGLPAGTAWVRPTLIVEVAFTEWTSDGRLRHPSLVGMRDDRPARDAGGEETMTEQGFPLTHPDRVVYPSPRTLKRDVAAYYERIAPLLLPHVAGRPLSVVRCPEGITKACFFQKHWTGALPPGIDTVTIREKSATRDYIVLRDAAGLMSLVQFGVLEIHPWIVLADNVEAPDRIVFDLDPGPRVPWSRVQDAARDVREVLQQTGLASWVKLTGGKGLHVVVPIARTSSWTEVSAFARAVAEHLEAADPARYLSRASKAARPGKIFVDWLRNTRGATWVAPWSTRSRAGAPVSAPISWQRLGATRAANEITLATVTRARLPADPWAEMLRTKQRLTTRMLEALGATPAPRSGTTSRRARA